MKKSFVITLALTFVLAIAGTAFAANPFTDVPANHWAYTSVSKLAQAGIVDGYGDGKFIGSSNMTRYEMAQIVAKAMANSDKADAATKAQIEKLAAEFSAELNKLGVRVATLEKKVDNVKITGEARFAALYYGKEKLGNLTSGDSYDVYELRTRLWLTGNVNDNWKYIAMLENKQDLQSNNQQTDTNFMRGYVQGKVGVLGITAGRLNYLSQYGTVLDEDADGLVLNYTNNKFTMDVFALRVQNDYANTFYAVGGLQKNTQIYGSQLGYTFTDKWHAGITYYDINGVGDNSNVSLSEYGNINTSILELGLDYKFDKNWFVWANYIKGGKAPAALITDMAYYGFNVGSSNGWAAGVQYGNIDKNKQGSYQLRASYYDVPYAGSINTQSIELARTFIASGEGFKGYVIGGSYMLAKNIDLNVDYFDFKSQMTVDGEKYKRNLVLNYIRFYF